MHSVPLVLAVRLLAPSDPEAECRALAASERYAEAAEACRRAFETIPDQADAFDRRSAFVFDAHNYYKLAQSAAGEADSRLLCDDVRMLQRFLDQLEALPSTERPEDREDAKRALEEAQAACPTVDPSAADPEPATNLPEPVRTVPEPPPAPLEQVAPTEPQRARRPLRAAGAPLLALGLSFGVVMAAALVDGAAMQRRSDHINERFQGQTIPMEEAMRFAEATRRGELDNRLAAGFGTAAGVLSIAGGVLLALDARRHGRTPRVALHPTLSHGPGLRVQVRF